MKSQPLAFQLYGVFSVTAPDGTDLTPRSRKACALLALLLDAPQYRRSRSALQDKLWSDRATEQGAASLRQELSQIRRKWGEWSNILHADAHIVSLLNSAVRISAPGSETFLEGIGVHDPEFENWLRERRQSVPGRLVLAAEHDRPPVLLVQTSSDQDSEVVADYVRSAIAKGIADWGGIDVRWVEEIGGTDPSRPSFRLQTRGQVLGDGIALRARLTADPSDQICWQIAEFLTPSDPDALARLVNGCIDRTLEALSTVQTNSTRSSAARYFLDMQMMFQTQGRDYDRLYRTFGERFEQDGRGIDLAFQAFLSCWAVGERHGRDLDAMREDAGDLIRRAIDIEPHNALVHALGSHVYGFVLGEYGIAHELARRSTRLDPNSTLGWAFKSVANINLGRTEEGYENILRARALSGEGHHGSMIDSLTVFSGVLSGHAAEVLPIGQTLCALKPGYAAPLRYMLAGYLSLGDNERARTTLEQLRTAEPDFELSYLAEPDYPTGALRRSELIDVKRITRLSAADL